MVSENWFAAIRYASKFPRLGSHRTAILRAKDAIHNPGFYRQLGYQPEMIFADGIKALQERYRWPS